MGLFVVKAIFSMLIIWLGSVIVDWFDVNDEQDSKLNKAFCVLGIISMAWSISNFVIYFLQLVTENL